MQLVSDPVELTSAATDLLLAVIAATGVVMVRQRHWQAFLTGLSCVSLLGASVHGLLLGDAAANGLWLLLNLSLGATVALFALAVLRESRGNVAARRALLPFLLIGLAVGATAQFFPSTFLPFIIFDAIVLIAAIFSGVRRQRWPLVAGCVVALLAGALQATGWRLTLIWEFDHNGLFHLAQIPALLLWIRAARTLTPS